MDLIDRQDAIDAIMGKTNDSIVEAQAIDILCDLPSAQQWTPISERLPDRKSFALVTDFGEVEEAYYDSDGHWWQVWGDRLKNVTAWMPLPKPYEEAKNAKV